MVRWWYFPLTKNWSGMLLIPLFMLCLTIYAVYKIYSGNNKINKVSSSSNSIEILNRQLVRGEIDEEEYKRKKEMLLKR